MPSHLFSGQACVLYRIKSLVIVAVGVSLSGTASAAPRSAWVWNQPSHPYGAANILGDYERETEVLTRFDAENFDRAYVSVQNLPLTSPQVVADWNVRLAKDGVSAQMLLGENSWIFPENRNSLLSIVQTRLVNYNAGRANPDERLKGLHLDIEPQGLTEWRTASATRKKELLYLLRDTYTSVRSQLDNFGGSEVQLYADLPVWFDSSTSIGWDDSLERDQWYDDIATSLDGITLMAFERRTLSSMISGVDWEVQNLPIEVRIGLNAAEIGPGETFADYSEFQGLAEQVETHYGTSIGGIDYQPFYTYTDEAPESLSNADFDGDGDIDGGDFLSWQLGYGTTSGATVGQGDANGNGRVNSYDLSAWQDAFGTANGSQATVPEPTAASLLLVVTGLFAAGRSRA